MRQQVHASPRHGCQKSGPMPETDEPGDHDAVIVACIQALDEFVNRSSAATHWRLFSYANGPLTN